MTIQHHCSGAQPTEALDQFREASQLVGSHRQGRRPARADRVPDGDLVVVVAGGAGVCCFLQQPRAPSSPACGRFWPGCPDQGRPSGPAGFGESGAFEGSGRRLRLWRQL